MAIAYEPTPTKKDDTGPSLPNGRPNGSLVSRQKRSIADATEYLRLKLKNNRLRKPVIFVLTSPGNMDVSNQPKFISRFVENMRANYGMGEYVWVRELTKRGYPHFHFVAEWHPSKWFFERDEDGLTNVEKISLYWSRQHSPTNRSKNSVRFGAYDKSINKRTSFYVTDQKQSWYLAKYIGKNIGDSGRVDYLSEAGFPSVCYRKTIRGFAISELLRIWSEPTIFDETFVGSNGEEIRTSEGFRLAQSIDRRFRCYASGLLLELNRDDLMQWDWRWTGHGETHIGIKRRLQKGGNKSD